MVTVTRWGREFPTDEDGQAAVAAGGRAAAQGLPREPPHPHDGTFTEGCLRVCWLRGWVTMNQVQTQARYGRPLTR